jgi:polysaccharide export outer membrane protein
MRGFFALFILTYQFSFFTLSAAPSASDDPDYRLRPLDTLLIKVYDEPDLSGTNKVSATGSLSLPLIGAVDVQGLKVPEAEHKIADMLKGGYIRNPQITITVETYAPRRVSVLGEVKKPGTFEIPAEENMTLLQAISRAEGFTNVAKTDEVIIRRIVRGKEQKLEVNATELMKARSSASDYPLEPGDVVVIPTRFF